MKRPSGFTPQRPAETGGGAGRLPDDTPAERPDPIPLFGRAAPKQTSDDGGGVPPLVSAQVSPREARKQRKRVEKAEVRRFTASARRLRRNWLVGTGSVVVLALVAVVAAYTPLLSVREIQVEGAFRVNSDAVVQDLSSQLGTPFPLVDDTAIKAALVTYPLIESYSVQARPPSTLVVRLVERTPVGALATPDGFTVVDAAGVVIEESTSRPPNYPLIAVDGGSEAPGFLSAAAVLRSLPEDLFATVDEVTATTQDDVTFSLRDGDASIVWGSADESKLKAFTLTKLMAAQPGFDVYDVSSPSVAVVR
ncbi:FtsQ-type POTRA domain-containing protein [Mycetocola zhadangensis]|uniref:FtsQ-type POTRA domain-containing protein n=1 Tax=Mycetocola zhadangensis TaxID=1164595 RepID=A0A3L7J6K5_9MICO|nr:FtsQ-type POTRA domain-containing protein [Mycetocola zhadangensis]RLQ86283.1 FtsQ-type POTRA domain-containing protein [Mycetocola zhadangensis]GGE89853.1 cell division protein FtsQ [Mycetocola zhadangensis]